MRPVITLILALFLSSFCYGQKPEVSYDHQAILVADLERSAQFYQTILGLKEIEDKTEQPHIRWFGMGDHKQLHIIQDRRSPEAPPKGTHMAFSTGNLEAMIDHLRKNNIYFENWMGTPNTTNPRPDGIRQVYLQDPDGYWIEINGK